VQLLAEHLLNVNASRQSQPTASPEFRANLEANVSDAIANLPKLVTGIDVNVKFDGIHSIEFTQETAVFDFLGIDLVHGWIPDPHEPAAAVLDARSYNDVVLRIVSALGQNATPNALSPASSRRFSGLNGSAGAPTASAQPTHSSQADGKPIPSPHKEIDAETLSAALRSTLTVSLPDATLSPASEGPGSSLPTGESGVSVSRDSVSSAINAMLGEVVKDAFRTPVASSNGRKSSAAETPSGAQSCCTSAAGQQHGDHHRDLQHRAEPIEGNEAVSSLAAPGSSENHAAAPEAAVRVPDLIDLGDDSALTAPTVAADSSFGLSRASPEEDMGGTEENNGSPPELPINQINSSDEGPRAPPPSAAHTSADLSSLVNRASGDRAAATSDGRVDAPNTVEQVDTARLHEAWLMRDFLEANSSQLTFRGLTALVEGLQDGQLAVLFRNNHFNVLLRYKHGLYILVTDQGYLYEPDVVWEHLCDVGGDTQLLAWNLKPFTPHAAVASEARGDDVPRTSGAAVSGPTDYSTQGIRNDVYAASADADFALAMQLQAEEEERAAAAEDQRRASAAAAAARQRDEEEHRRRQATASGRQRQAYSTGAASEAELGERRRRKRTSDCSVM
jgi:ubiquitin carboxyl-terminal hydrolase MINDY-1/2